MTQIIKNNILLILVSALIIGIMVNFVSKTRDEIRSQQYVVVDRVESSTPSQSIVIDSKGNYFTVPSHAKINDRILVDCEIVNKYKTNCKIENQGQ